MNGTIRRGDSGVAAGFMPALRRRVAPKRGHEARGYPGDFVEENVPLAGLTWYGIGGPARRLARPRSADELADLLRNNDLPVYALGLGANLLVADAGVDGLVVKLDAPAFRDVEIDRTTVTVGGGATMQKLVQQMARRGLGGLECLAGVPGTIGGGVRMNAGGRHGDLGSRVRSVTTMTADGTVVVREDVDFGYRTCDVDEPFILAATLELEPDNPAAVTLRTREIMAAKVASQPFGAKSAGCMFKNPPGDSAGRLIDLAGGKGLRVGGAEVSPRHANFVVAHAGCRADDIEALVTEVRRRVREEHGVDLQTEVERWP